jgi:hypothetical protein
MGYKLKFTHQAEKDARLLERAGLDKVAVKLLDQWYSMHSHTHQSENNTCNPRNQYPSNQHQSSLHPMPKEAI